MSDIRVTKGLILPIKGSPELARFPKGTSDETKIFSKRISIDLQPFRQSFLQVLVREGDEIMPLQPLVRFKDSPSIVLPSPVKGRILEVRRGEKRKLLEIIIERDEAENIPEYSHNPNFQGVEKIGVEEIQKKLTTSGLLTRFFVRPFHRPVVSESLAKPRSCFVRAITTRPFDIPYELQLQGKEGYFSVGLEAVSKYLSCPVHVVMQHNPTGKYSLQKSISKNTQNIFYHTVEGPYPACSPSLHIQKIDPITDVQDSVWCIDAIDIARIGYFLENERLDMPMFISVAGEGIKPEKRGYVKTLEGSFIADLVERSINGKEDANRFISGDPLTGYQVSHSGYLRRSSTILSVIPEQDESQRQFLHFLRLGKNSFSATKAYLSGHMNPLKHSWHFTTNMHGEERPFIDGSVYEKVMPMNILPMQLVKALMAEEYDVAIEYGLLEVTADDFAACEFICPSKIPMMDIVEQGIDRCIQELVV